MWRSELTSAPLPDLEHIALIPNGDVVALPGSSAPADPVRHAATMLNILVEDVATPPELEQFLQRNVANPPQLDSLEEFSRQLAFFERPGRRTDVERLVGRAAAAEQMTRADEELKRLMEKANEADEKPEKELSKEQRPLRKLPTLVVAAAVLIGALALVTMGLSPRFLRRTTFGMELPGGAAIPAVSICRPAGR